MALHMMIERIRPELPSRAPAVMRSLLLSTKPMATADRPAYEFRMEMTVGMSAPPMGRMSSTPKARDRTSSPPKAAGAQGASGCSTRAVPRARARAKSARLMTFWKG